MATKKQRQEKQAKKIFFTILIAWLAAFPAIIIFQIIMRSLFSDVDLLITITNTISTIGAMLGFFGWIPLIISTFYWDSKK